MDPDSSYQLIILVVLVFISAIFTAAETAFHSLNKFRLRNLLAEMNPQAMVVSSLLSEPVKLFNTILIGDSMANIAAVVLGTLVAIRIWGSGTQVLLLVAALTGLIIVFGELLPRIIASQRPEKTALALGKVLRLLTFCLYPVVIILNSLTHVFSRVLGAEPQAADSSVTEDEIISLVAAGQEEGVIHQEETSMIHGVFDFTDTVVRDVMVPRPDIVALDKDASLEELVKVIREEQFSRIPVYEHNVDNILGVVHIKDLFATLAQGQEGFSLADYLRQPLFVPETKKVNELFMAMKKEKNHMAIVLDEYGSTAGLVTLENLIEEILGDIQDEHDMEEPELKNIDPHTVEINGGMRIDEVNERLGLDLECEEADTLGGLVFAELGRVPVEGNKIQVGNVELEVLMMDGHRIEKLKLTRPGYQTGM